MPNADVLWRFFIALGIAFGILRLVFKVRKAQEPVPPREQSVWKHRICADWQPAPLYDEEWCKHRSEFNSVFVHYDVWTNQYGQKVVKPIKAVIWGNFKNGVITQEDGTVYQEIRKRQ